MNYTEKILNSDSSYSMIGSNGCVFECEEIKEATSNYVSVLREKGIVSGEFVAVLSKKSCTAVCSVMAISELGAISVPIDCPEARKRVEYILEDCKPDWILIFEGFCDVIYRYCMETGYWGCYKSEGWLLLKRNKVRREELVASNGCMMFYTTGSTNEPKGVLQSHESFIHFFENFGKIVRVTEGSVVANCSSLSWDMACFEVYCGLARGASVCLIPQEDVKNPFKLALWVIEYGITVWESIPKLFVAMMDCMEQLVQKDEIKLRTVILTGETPLPSDIHPIMRGYENIDFVNVYGQTEINNVFANRLSGELSPETRERNSFSLGKPIDGVSALLVDAESGDIIEELNCRGVLAVQSATNLIGYYASLYAGRADESVFFYHGKRYHKTGDYFYFDQNGDYWFDGRVGSWQKVKGHRVSIDSLEKQVKSELSIDYELYFLVHKEELVVCSENKIEMKRIYRALEFTIPCSVIPRRSFYVPRLPYQFNGKIDRLKLAEMCKEMD